jgi:hypothetical protein
LNQHLEIARFCIGSFGSITLARFVQRSVFCYRDCSATIIAVAQRVACLNVRRNFIYCQNIAKFCLQVKHQKNSSTSKTVWFSLLSLHARNSEGEPFRVHYRPGSGLADIATINDKSWELWQCVPSESVVADEGTEELDIRRSRSVFHLVNQKSKSGLALLDGAPVLVKQPGHPFKVKILAQPYKAKENISSSSSSPDGSVVVGGGEELQHAQDVEGEAIVAATVPLVKCDIQNVALTLLYETAGGLHLLPLLRLHMYDMGAVLQVGSFKTRAMSGCNISLDYFEAQSNCW